MSPGAVPWSSGAAWVLWERLPDWWTGSIPVDRRCSTVFPWLSYQNPCFISLNIQGKTDHRQLDGLLPEHVVVRWLLVTTIYSHAQGHRSEVATAVTALSFFQNKSCKSPVLLLKSTCLMMKSPVLLLRPTCFLVKSRLVAGEVPHPIEAPHNTPDSIIWGTREGSWLSGATLGMLGGCERYLQGGTVVPPQVFVVGFESP